MTSDDPCPACGGSGLRADEHDRLPGPKLTAEQRTMMDTTRCYTCAGSGRRDDAERMTAWIAALQRATDPPSALGR
jgi:DnaJ-class molecular chaperone